MDFVKQNQEYMSQNTGVDVDGLKDLVNSLNEEIYEKVKNEYKIKNNNFRKDKF